MNDRLAATASSYDGGLGCDRLQPGHLAVRNNRPIVKEAGLVTGRFEAQLSIERWRCFQAYATDPCK